MRSGGTGSKAQRDQLRRTMREDGCTLDQIAIEMMTRWGFRPRQAWRHAHGLTQDEVAAQYNRLLDDSRAPMTGKRISDYETWPHGGVKPTVAALSILAKAFGTSSSRLIDQDDRKVLTKHERVVLAAQPVPAVSATEPAVHLITSGTQLSAAMIEVAQGARESLVAVGSRSADINYLQAIERALADRPSLVHYRVLIGLPHNQVLKDHLLRLLEPHNNGERVHISLHIDLTRHHERFFVASEQAAVAALPSTSSPMNFDTGLLVRDPAYVQGLLQHGKALHGKHRLESLEAVQKLEVLG